MRKGGRKGRWATHSSSSQTPDSRVLAHVSHKCGLALLTVLSRTFPTHLPLSWKPNTSIKIKTGKETWGHPKEVPILEVSLFPQTQECCPLPLSRSKAGHYPICCMATRRRVSNKPLGVQGLRTTPRVGCGDSQTDSEHALSYRHLWVPLTGPSSASTWLVEHLQSVVRDTWEVRFNGHTGEFSRTQGSMSGM